MSFFLSKYKNKAIKEIRKKIIKKGIKAEDLGSEYLMLFPMYCRGCDVPGKYSWHILFCLDTREEIDNFKNQVLAIIKEAADFKNVKKQAIDEVEVKTCGKKRTENQYAR